MYRRGWFVRLAAVLLLCSFDIRAAQQPVSPAPEHWVATWATAQTLFRAGGGGRGAVPAGLPAAGGNAPVTAPPTVPAAAPAAFPGRRFPVPATLAGVNNQTLRMVFRVSLGGERIRVRFVNAFGANTVVIGAAAVARSAGDSAIDPTTNRRLTFGGRGSATMYAGQVLVSDPVDLRVPALSDLAVSVHIASESGPPTDHRFALRTTYISQPGDFTGAAAMTDAAMTRESWYWLAAVDVAASAPAAAIVTFGDSITDGDQSTHGTNGDWPSILARRLQANRSTSHLAVVNAGISGNRVLGDNNSGVVRVGPHALDVAGVSWVTVLEGINDITAATRPGAPPSSLTSEDLIRGYRQIITRAHARGIRVAGCTITPFGGSAVHTAAGEAMRQEVNTWIRTSGAFDAVIDFDAATRDPLNPTRFRSEVDSPDLLHPGDAGYRLMAEAIDLSIFTTASATGGRAR